MHSTYPAWIDPSFDHDACGVGFIAARDGRSSFGMLRLAVECLVRLDHRGAKAADGTGDGAGLLTQLPYEVIERHLAVVAPEVPERERLGLVMAFLPGDRAEEGRAIVDEALATEEIGLVSWRVVPIDPAALSQRATASLPRIEQAIVAAPPGWDEETFERRLFLARKAMERKGTHLEGFTIPSASCRTVVYKGLFTASKIDQFYWDLRDPRFETSFAIFHQRYSTNTFPSWSIAQPFRSIAHNGEINTIRSNRAWMVGREVNATSQVWGERVGELRPFLEPEQSDSGSLDNAFELLLRTGRSLAHVKEMLLPAAWENLPDLDPDLRAFYEYHAFLTEPWDGPAAVAATDGKVLLAAMDRNGLRPARWAITPDVVLVASEAGVCPVEEAQALATGQLGPGETITFEPASGRIAFSDQIRSELAALAPYRSWVDAETLYVQDPFDPLQDDRFDPARFNRVFGYTSEERRMVLKDMAEGKTPTGSMGNDTPLAVLSTTPRRITHYFHELFAQVTNPPMDHIREELVMSLRTYLGRRGSLLEETAQQAHLIELASPVLSDAELERIVRAADLRFFSYWIGAVFAAEDGADGLRRRLVEVCDEAEEAVRGGASIVVLSDREVDADQAPIPMLLAVGAVHHRLIETGLRMDASIVVVSAEPRDSHDLACLIAFGASAVNPYLAIEQCRALAEADEIAVDPVVAQENYRAALNGGLLKVMSKMGICTVSAYRGSELFEVIGLDDEVAELAFRFAPRRMPGAGFDRLAAHALEWHQRFAEGEEDSGGFYKHRGGGVLHVTGPAVVLAAQRAARSGDPADWQAYLDRINDRPPSLVRDLLEFTDRRPVPVDEVEPAEFIMRRFVGAAMSHGAISKEAHEALAEAMNVIGALSNSGEGGEAPERYGSSRNSGIKQVASGRFGVTPAYLASAEELQIKMAQGSKPGEGGQLPGHKVSLEIARLRHTDPGITLISPPPHHDIYSIEDLAQLIYDLKAFNPMTRVSVKLVSEPGVGTVAVGVAKAQADAILISGAEGGTGASPLISIKHAGSPWEMGLAEAHQVLVANGLRSRVALETDGGLRTGRDVMIAALLGAERFGFGTLPLLALGCKMVRQCHLNTCPVGIATQQEDLRAKFAGAPEQVVTIFRLLAEEMRQYLAALGVRTVGEVIGRADLLRPANGKDPLAASLRPMLLRAEGRRRHPGYLPIERPILVKRILEDVKPALERGEHVDLSYPIANVDRTVGATLSGEVTKRHGADGLPDGTITVRLSGTAGQSFGAWLAPGIALRLDGPANDYVGKGLGGGTIVVTPHLSPGGDSEGWRKVPQAAGNAVLYGATAGELFMSGRVGQRFAVRNSGATAVVEGASDHCCEYMTGGLVVVLGEVGRNLAAGMTGGVAYVWDPNLEVNRVLADTAPAMRRLLESEAAELRFLVERHLVETSSSVARSILDDWPRQVGRFWVLRAKDPDVPSRPVGERLTVNA
jgi:glutamate synthase (ferredoxin)